MCSKRFPYCRVVVTRERLALAVLGLLLVLPFIPLLLVGGDRILGHPLTDGSLQFRYWTEFAGRSWRAGQVPFWNPFLMLGVPFLGEGQAAIFHPLSVLFILLPIEPAMNSVIILSFLLAGFAFWGYLRSLRLSPSTAMLGAVVWCFSSQFISRIVAGHLSMLMGFFSWPFILMCWERYRTGHRLLSLLGISVGYGLLILAGHPQSTFVFSLFLMLYAVIQVVIADRSKATFRDQTTMIGSLVISLVLGIGLASIQLLPTFDFALNSFRGVSSYQFSSMFSFPPENIITLICPFFFGTEISPGPDYYWGRNYLWEMWVYLGIMPLVAAAIGLFAAPRHYRLPLISGAFIFMVLGLGRHTPVYRWGFEIIPFFGLFRSPAKYTLITVFCLVTLAAFGFQHIRNGFCRENAGSSGYRAVNGNRDTVGFAVALVVAATLVVIVVIGLAYFIPGHERPDSHWAQLIRWRYAQGETFTNAVDWTDPALLSATALSARSALLHALVMGSAVFTVILLSRHRLFQGRLFPMLMAVVIVDLSTLFMSQIRTYSPPRSELLQAIARTMPPAPYPPRIFDLDSNSNQGMAAGLSVVGGYVSATLTRYNNFLNAIQKLPMTTSHAVAGIRGSPALFRILAVEFVVLNRAPVAPGMDIVATSVDKMLVKVTAPSPRAFLAAAPRGFDDSEAALDYVTAGDHDAISAPAVEGAVIPVAHPLAPDEAVDIIRFTPNQLELAVRTRQPRIMILNEMIADGWHAVVNGQETEVFPANYIFRGILVPAGASSVTFRYCSSSFRFGVVLSCVSVFVLVIGFLVAATGRGLPHSSRKIDG